MKKGPRILYFIKSAVPSDEDIANAKSYGTNVVFRNANFVPNEGTTEKCDGVAGEIPNLYKNCVKAEEILQLTNNSNNIKNEECIVNKSNQKPTKKVEWKPNV